MWSRMPPSAMARSVRSTISRACESPVRTCSRSKSSSSDGRGNFGASPKPPYRGSKASLNCFTVFSSASAVGTVHTGAAACSSDLSLVVSASADSTTLLRSAFQTRAISCRMSTKPGRPHFDAGGKYVPP